MEGIMIVNTQQKRKEDCEQNCTSIVVTDDVQINEIRKDFIPKLIYKKRKGWICPLCKRPHHKEPGPFTYGMTMRKDDNTIILWAQSLGCCKWNQYFPIDDIKHRKITPSNLISVLRECLYSK